MGPPSSQRHINWLSARPLGALPASPLRGKPPIIMGKMQSQQMSVNNLWDHNLASGQTLLPWAGDTEENSMVKTRRRAI